MTPNNHRTRYLLYHLIEAVESDAVDEVVEEEAECDSREELLETLLGDAPTSWILRRPYRLQGKLSDAPACLQAR